MMRRFLFLMGIIVCITFQKTEAQNVVFDTTNTIITGDTIVNKVNPIKQSKRIKRPHSAKKATIMSACLPGLGQVYNGKWWKVPIAYAGFGGLGYLVYNNYSEYRSYLHAYEYATGDLPENVTLTQYETELANKYVYSQLQIYKESYRRNLELFSIITVAWYGLNILDACVDGHLYTYDIDDNLSLNIDPYLYPAKSPLRMPQYAQVGLSFKLNF